MKLSEDVQLICSGYQIANNNTDTFYYIARGSENHELLVCANNGSIISGYKIIGEEEYCYVDKKAKDIYNNIKAADKKCKVTKSTKSKSSCTSVPTMHKIGAAVEFRYKDTARTCEEVKYNGEIVELDFRSDAITINMTYYGMVPEIKATTGVDFNNLGLNELYIRLTAAKKKVEKLSDDDDIAESAVDEIGVETRTLEEIALDKDITWLHNKKYYVINDEYTAEKLISAFERYNGPISYDVETSGLHINMFGQYGSPKCDELAKWNEEHPNERIKQDYLVGFSLTVEKDTGYYFPVTHRKFKNLYEDRSEGSTGLQLARNIKSAYVVGAYRDRNDYMAQYIRATKEEDIPCDVLLMERCRYIFEQKNILAFNGIFEWKTTWLYSIDLHLTEDPMILHQLLYKFKRVRVGHGEPSNLKYLTKVECGVDQLDLADFFVGYKEDDTNSLRAGTADAADKKKKKSKKGLNIDFSWMDLRGTQAYAPADVDFALAIWEKYKYDLIHNYPETEYIYSVEVLMACAVAYAEFYGLRINEDKIEAVRKKNIVDIALYEHEFRKVAGLCVNDELVIAEQLKASIADSEDMADDAAEKLAQQLNNIVAEVGNLNMNAPQQVANLLYDKYKWPLTEDGKKSMGKKVIKPYMSAKDDAGNLLYPEVTWYRKYKDAVTLDTKFFGKLREFTYPGGFMFASFGSISCSTGRMSCRTPNLQQMPKSISKIIEPRDGFVFCDADFAQIELRILMALAEELGLIEYFKDPDADMHSKLASMLFDLPFSKVDIPDETGKSPRQQCKGLNFGIPYGMGIPSLAITLYGSANDLTKRWAKAKYDKYFEEMPRVREFFADVKERAQVNEYTATFFGRRRYYSFTDKEGNYSQKYVAMALRQAGNAVIQGTAADIFKIAMVRIFSYIRREHLLGKVLMSNFIHDEGLYEIKVDEVNVNEVLANIIVAQQVQIKGFPPLNVGAGIGKSWAAAKGGMAEINPLLAQQIISWGGTIDVGHTTKEVYDFYEKLNENFRKGRIAEYIKREQAVQDSGTIVKEVDPVMAKLMTLAFDYGVEAQMKTEAQIAGLSGEAVDKYMAALDTRRLRAFIENNPEMFEGLNITWIENVSQMMATQLEEEEDVGYEDDDDDDEEITEYEFAMIDESNEIFGLSVQDIIEMFGLLVSEDRGICGIDIRRLKPKELEAVADIIEAHTCEPEEEGAMEVLLMKQNRLILKPGVYVKGIQGNDLKSASKNISI